MTISARTIRIAVLKCDTLLKPISDIRGQFDQVFNDLLSPAAERLNRKSKDAPIIIDTIGYDVVRGEYPPSLDSIDALLITGSFSSAYDPLPWIGRLEDYIQEIYTSHPNIKLFGACFGHQIICQALLRNTGIFVEKSPAGGEIGVYTVNLEPEFAAHFPQQLAASSKTQRLNIQLEHGDHVVVPVGSLPEGWILVGETELCKNQGVYEPHRVLTYQGHPEFDRFIVSECAKWEASVSNWTEERLIKTLEVIDRDDESDIFADIAVGFLLQGPAILGMA